VQHNTKNQESILFYFPTKVQVGHSSTLATEAFVLCDGIVPFVIKFNPHNLRDPDKYVVGKDVFLRTCFLITVRILPATWSTTNTTSGNLKADRDVINYSRDSVTEANLLQAMTFGISVSSSNRDRPSF
jgi:hypothetical protein